MQRRNISADTVTIPIHSLGDCSFNDELFGRRHVAPKNLRIAIYQPFHKIEIMKSQDVIVSLFALAQESRLAVFRLLVKRGPDGYTPGELADKLALPAPTLSFHLKELSRAKLIVGERDGRFLHYKVNFERMEAVISFLTDQCCSLADGGSTVCAPASKPTTRSSATKKAS
jgi:ArsR family transcriptional regulator, arsenate/arsenite/antimonite-responsive transcriptional repressor